MPFDKRTLVYPSETQFGERTIVARGDVVVADGARVDLGLETHGRVFLGERASVAGPVHAAGDVRMDLFSEVRGDVVTASSAFLGERARITGRLHVEGDLDVGNDVEIGEGFEAHGWINVRNPVPMVMYLFIYLLQLLQMGKSEEVERILREVQESGEESLVIREGFTFIPDGCTVTLTESRVRGNLDVGGGARVLGNHDVDGWARVGKVAKLVGALRATGDVTLEDASEVHGDLVARGAVVIGDGCHVLGRVEAERVEMRQSARVDGEIVAPDGIKFVTPALVAMKEKVEAFETSKAADVLDLLG